jgi:hypothetical protein
VKELRRVDPQTGQVSEVAGVIRAGSEWEYQLAWPRGWKATRWRVMALGTQYPYPFEEVIIRSLLPADDGIWLVMTPHQLVTCWREVTPAAAAVDAAAPVPLAARDFDPRAAIKEVSE